MGIRKGGQTIPDLELSNKTEFEMSAAKTAWSV